MSKINYSKWDHIEVSDDEDDTHPNIDTPSLFRWRHQARLERDAQWEQDRAKFEADYKDFLSRQAAAEKNLKQAEESKNETKITEAKKQMEGIKKEEEIWAERHNTVKKQEKLRPWNIDTICHEGKSKTIINKTKKEEPKPLSEDEQVEKLRNFVKDNDKFIKKFGMFQKPDDSMNYLLEKPQLVCDETANRLVLWCIDLAVEKKTDLMNHVSHQTIVMQFMLELAKSLKIDPRNCIRPFFAKFKTGEPEYMKAFNEELDAFRSRVNKRAEERIAEAVAELEREEKEERIKNSPGGLDPMEVFESLPKELQQCFEAKDIPLLQETIAKMEIKEAEYHLDRCIKSGLWVPGPDDDNEEKATDSTAEPDTENPAGDATEVTEPTADKPAVPDNTTNNLDAYDLD